MSTKYVATLRAIYEADDDVGALWIADMIKEYGGKHLEYDEGDSLEVTQVTDLGINLLPEETILRLKQARNLLIKTRLTYCWDEARQLDKTIWSLEHRDEHQLLGGYDYGKLLEIADKILKGENPLDV